MSESFGVLIFPGAEELDFVGPWEMLTMWSKFAEGPGNCLLVAESMGPVRCAKGMVVVPHVSFETCPPLDYLLVPGGQGTRTEVSNKVLLEFVSRQAGGCKAVLSVCTGSFVLHAAGLLSGKRATTHCVCGRFGRHRSHARLHRQRRFRRICGQGALKPLDLVVERADLASFVGDVMEWVKARVSTAKLVVADLSTANPNVYLEVGYAWGRGVPTILVVRKNEELKFDIRGQRCLEYESIQELESKLATEATTILSGSAEPRTPDANARARTW